MAAFKKFLVPTDFSKASTAALEQACALADSLNASLCLLHAVENPYGVGPYTEFYSLPQDFFERLEENARRNLEATLTPEQKERYRATTILRRGGAAREILNYLDEDPEIDLVVMATHGRGGVARLMMGSVTDKIVRSARCPVLTIGQREVEDAHTVQT
jgi:nucleotide-binding universal stress UspA family protein